MHFNEKKKQKIIVGKPNDKHKMSELVEVVQFFLYALNNKKSEAQKNSAVEEGIKKAAHRIFTKT